MEFLEREEYDCFERKLSVICIHSCPEHPLVPAGTDILDPAVLGKEGGECATCINELWKPSSKSPCETGETEKQTHKQVISSLTKINSELLGTQWK